MFFRKGVSWKTRKRKRPLFLAPLTPKLHQTAYSRQRTWPWKMQLYSDAGGSVSAPALPADVRQANAGWTLSGRLSTFKGCGKGHRAWVSGTDAGAAVCFCGEIFKQRWFEESKGGDFHDDSWWNAGEGWARSGYPAGRGKARTSDSASDSKFPFWWNQQGGNGPAVSGSVISGIWSVEKCIWIYDIPCLFRSFSILMILYIWMRTQYRVCSSTRSASSWTGSRPPAITHGRQIRTPSRWILAFRINWDRKKTIPLWEYSFRK